MRATPTCVHVVDERLERVGVDVLHLDLVLCRLANVVREHRCEVIGRGREDDTVRGDAVGPDEEGDVTQLPLTVGESGCVGGGMRAGWVMSHSCP